VFGGYDGRSLVDSTLVVMLTHAGSDGSGKWGAEWEDVSADLKGAPKARFAHAQASTGRALFVFGGIHEGGGCLADTNKLELS
jgi:hypothetical protein